MSLRSYLQLIRRLRGEQWGDPWGYAFVAPAVLMYLVFSAWPTIRGVTIAFQDYRFLVPGHYPFNGLGNYVEMANDPMFWASLGRSAYFIVLYIPLIVLIPMTIAALIAKIYHPVEAGVYRVISYLPVVLPIAVAMLLWRQLLNQQFGYVNFFLQKVLHLPFAPGWISEPEWSIPTLVIASVWQHMGTNVLLFLIGMYNISRDYYEAASIDGAGAWAQFRHVTIPLLKPVLVLVLVFAVQRMGATQESLILFGAGSGTITNAGPMDAGMTLGRYAYQIAFLVGDMRWGYGAGINLVLGLIGIGLSTIVFRALRVERPD